MANDYSGKIRNEIQELKKRNAELEASAEHTKRYGYEVGQNQKRIEVYNRKLEEIRKNEEKINDLTADRIGLGKQINNITKSFSGDLLKQLGVEDMGRVLIVNLKPSGHVTKHNDQGTYADHYSRFHIVLKSNKWCSQTCGDQEQKFEVGEVWWFNHKELHTAHNVGMTDRVHIIFDCVTKYPL